MRVRAVMTCAAALLLAAVSSPAALGEAGPRDLRGNGSGLAAGFDPFVARKGERGVYLVQLRFGSAGTTCLYLLPSAFEECDATYFADYSAYNSTLTAVAVDAGALGLSNAINELSYAVTQCSGFAGTTEVISCETVGSVDASTGTYGARLNVTDPAHRTSPPTCGDFFGAAPCGHRVRRIGATRRGPEPPHRLPEQPASPTDPDRRYDDVTSSQTRASLQRAGIIARDALR